MKFKTFFTLSMTDKQERPYFKTSGAIEYYGQPKDAGSSELVRLVMNRAAVQGDVDLLAFLLQHGATVKGMEALPLAIDSGQEAAAVLLIQTGADVTAIDRDTKQTLLHRAARHGQAETCQALLSTGKIKVDAKNAQKSTALHCAASIGHLKTVQVLLAAGASKKAKNYFSNTPLKLAQLNGHAQVAALLEKKRDASENGGGFFSRSNADEPALDPLAPPFSNRITRIE